jgi:hypothetical protein
MPTPDDAMLSPTVEHEGILPGRVTCPPEESRIHSAHSGTGQQSLHADNNDNAALAQPTQQPTPPPADRERHSDIASPTDGRMKASDREMDGPLRDIPTPLSSQDETAEEQRNSNASQVTATTPPQNSWNRTTLYSSPFPSHRV